MNKILVSRFLDDEKLLKKLKENSYYIKDLNRDFNNFKNFVNDMKIIYKERTSDKISNAIDSIDMVSDIIDTLK